MGAGKEGTVAIAFLAETDFFDFLDFDVSSMASLLLVFRKSSKRRFNSEDFPNSSAR